MKKSLLVLSLVLTVLSANAQFVTIPDANFVSWLQTNYPTCMNGNQMDTTCSGITSTTSISSLATHIVDLTGIEYFDNLTTLDCHSNDIAFIPRLPNALTSLLCYDNKLTNLPVLPNSLKNLNCGHNLIVTLPALPASLLTLDCSYDSILSLPALPGLLTDLSCQNNKLTSIPALPSGLKYLYCDHNNLTNLPALPASLLYLSFSNNHFLGSPSLPASLILLNCSNNQISSLPALPATLTGFYCNNNLLTSLPTLPPPLQNFYCNNNLLTSLPTLPAPLQTFYCNNNQLTVLPALPGLIQTILCNNNQLTSLPALPPSATYLKCGYNQLTSIPAFPTSIQTFTCEHNLITSLPALPSTLQSLICFENQLTSLPALSNGLTYLRCEFNNISCFPPFPTNTFLSIFPNPATCLPNYTSPMTSFELAYPLCATGNISSNPYGCSSSEGITGVVYKGNNSNCMLDTADTRINGACIKEFDSGGTLIAQSYSFYDGRYYFQNTAGTYNVAFDTVNNPFTVNCIYPGVDSTVILTASSQLAKDINFEVGCKPGFDVGVLSVHNFPRAFPGTQHILQVKAGDLSQTFHLNCAAGVGGQVTVTVTGPVTYDSIVNGSIAPAVSGNVFTYTIADFGTVSLSDLQLWFTTDTAAVTGDTICVAVTVTPTIGDNNPSNNSYNYCYFVSNSRDPNVKETYPVDVQSGYSDYFTYTVNFQNTGSAPAMNISVVDTLAANLDLSTFQLINYSNDNITNLLGNTLIVRFPNINLADSTSNEPASHGFFQYRIKPLAGLPGGTQIRNTASIYFDYNPPVRTNTTVNNFMHNLGIGNDHSLPAQITISPNPSSGLFSIASSSLIKEVKVMNVLGEVVVHQLPAASATAATVDLSAHSKGIYFVHVQTDKGIISKKIIKN